MPNQIIHGDCSERLPDIETDSIDCIVTDPPYGMSFMGKQWDKAVPSVDIWRECVRVLKPGAFAFVMCIPRQDCLAHMIVNLGDAGFNVAFSSIYWTYASGFPKAQNLSKVVDKRNGRNWDEQYEKKSNKSFITYLNLCRKKKEMTLNDINIALGTAINGGGTASAIMGNRKFNEIPTKNTYKILKNILDMDNRFDKYIEERDEILDEAEREVIGEKEWTNSNNHFVPGAGHKERVRLNETAPATSQAKALDGAYGGFQPKPAVEIIIVAMKPLTEKTYIDQAMSNMHGCTWLDDCRIPYENKDFEKAMRKNDSFKNSNQEKSMLSNPIRAPLMSKGRFPANVLCEDNVLNDGRITKSTGGTGIRTETNTFKGTEGRKHFHCGNSGSFSGYFDLDAWFAERIKQLPKEALKTFPWLIVPKASKQEKGEDTKHPTVKPIKLMSWLTTLASREGDIVLDPFVGSGTTCIAAKMLGRQYIGIEREEEYCEIACKRLAAIAMNLDGWAQK